MRILVNDIAASHGGAMSILKQFYQFVCENDSDNEWIFLLSGTYLEEKDKIRIIICPKVKKSWFHKLCFDFLRGSKYIEQYKPDVVLSLQNIITFGLRIPQYVYIHQSLPFQNEKNFSFFVRKERAAAIYQHLIGRIIKLSAQKADGIIVQTEWMKRAVLKKLNNKKKRCIVARPDVYRFEPKSEITNSWNRFFYPTNGEIYKNDSIVFEACELLKQMGIHDFIVNLTLPTNADNKTENVKCVGRIPTQEMQKMYASSVLIFPSYIETVGLPLLEAMQFGTVIFAADCEYAHEILGDYSNAYFFCPWDSNELCNLMKSSIEKRITMKPLNSIELSIESQWRTVVDFILPPN